MKPPVPNERQTQRAILRIRTIPEMTDAQLVRFFEKREPLTEEECWLWNGPPSTGRYGLFRIGGSKYLPHRVAWTIAHGPVPSDLCVCHHCDNPRCVNPTHLFLGTHQDNMMDRAIKGRNAHSPGWRGERSTSAKLKTADILAIRADVRGQYELAEVYGVNQSTISDIKRRATWSHI